MNKASLKSFFGYQKYQPKKIGDENGSLCRFPRQREKRLKKMIDEEMDLFMSELYIENGNP